MSKVESGQSESAVYVNDRLEEMAAALGQVPPEEFVARLLDKLVADGFMELKPGCTREQTAGLFSAALKNLKFKLPAGS